MQKHKKFIPANNIPLHKSIRYRRDLTPGEKIFYAEISAMEEDGKVHFSSRKLSDILGFSHQTILNYVRRLEERDLIDVHYDQTRKDCLGTITIKC